MKTTNENKNAAHDITAARLQALAAAYATDPKSDATAAAVYAVCVPAVHSVLNRCLTVTAAASAAEKLRRMKNDVSAAVRIMAAYDETAAAADRIGIGYDDKGKMTAYRYDAKTETQKAAAAVHAVSSLGTDGMDLVQTAAACLLDELQKAAAVNRAITEAYTATKPARRSIRFYGCGNDAAALQKAAAAAPKEYTILPIQAVYRAIRAAIRAAAAVDASTVYLQDMTESDIDNALYAICPFAYDAWNDAAAAAASLDKEAETVKKMHLTPIQKTILDLLRYGHSYTTAAAALGVSPDTIRRHKYSLQAAAVDAGIAPPEWMHTNGTKSAAAAVIATAIDGSRQRFTSQKAAAAALGVPRSRIYDALRSGKPTHGYIFTAE